MDARAGSLWHKTAGEAIPRNIPRHRGGPVCLSCARDELDTSLAVISLHSLGDYTPFVLPKLARYHVWNGRVRPFLPQLSDGIFSIISRSQSPQVGDLHVGDVPLEQPGGLDGVPEWVGLCLHQALGRPETKE